MLDLRWIREHSELLDAALINRGLLPQADALLALDKDHREALSALQAVQQERNALSGPEARDRGLELRKKSETLEAHVQKTQKALETVWHALPNVPDADVPLGTEPVEIRTWGTKPLIEAPKTHEALGLALGLMDFERAAAVSGARFVFLRGALAKLERALAAFMLDMHAKAGYEELSAPLLVRSDAAFGTGNLPKFGDEMFKTEDGRYLIPTAETVVTNWVCGRIVPERDLPMRFACWTPCFRSEAGSAGRDVKGMFRMHQFYKVELVHFCVAEATPDEHVLLMNSAEAVLKALDLAYRLVFLPQGDMGPNGRRCYDLEVWLPGQNAYREISSCSAFGDFQARRMNARVRRENGKLEFLHTLNGSGLAVGRTLIAILEQGQQPDGSVAVPKALQIYMGGEERIVPCA